MAAGWRDPRIRLLRSIAALVTLGLIGYVVLDDRSDDLATLGTLAGVLLVTLGFEAGIRFPRGGDRDGR